MAKYSIHQAKTHFSKLIQKSLNGEEVIILNRDRPILKLVAIQKEKRIKLLGDMEGAIKILDGFDEIPVGFEDYI